MLKRLQLSYKQTFEQMYLQLKHHRKGRDINLVPKTTKVIHQRKDGSYVFSHEHDFYQPITELH